MSSLKSLSPSEYKALRTLRWKGRTDLGFLCREILNYKDVSNNGQGPWHDLHQDIIERLQHFKLPSAEEFEKNDRIVAGKWVYTPICSMYDLEGKRRRLILDSRSTLKTTINTIAHGIQWILNYPDIAMLILMAADGRASDVLGEMKRHFQFNPRFRELYPEHCPQRAISDWGTMQRFTTEARAKTNVAKEPTVMTGSIEKGAAGYHFHVIKFSDIVDENNIAGNGSITVRQKFDISHSLLISPRDWIDVEGTRYLFSDTYGKILEREAELPPEDREYIVYIRGIFKRDVPGGEKYDSEDAKSPYLLDENGKRISIWPERFPTKKLEIEEKNDPWIFSCQKLNNPAMNVEGAAPFPVNAHFPKKIRRSDFEQNVRVAYKEITVDFASTDNQRSNFSVVMCSTIDHYGRVYIEEIQRGRWLANQAVDNMFDMALKHKRHLRCVKIEESEYLRGLLPTIERKMDLLLRPKGININFSFIKRGNRTTKAERIYKSLQPWYNGIRMAGESKEVSLRFLDDIEPLAWAALLKEMEQFPACETDDIMDCLADVLADKEYFGREIPRGNPTEMRRDKDGNWTPESMNAVNRIYGQVQKEALEKWLDIRSLDDEALDGGYGKKVISLL